MKNILAFCFFPAFVPTSNGGQSRLYNFYKSLSVNYNVTLLTSTHLNTQEETIYHGINFIERRVPKDEYFVKEYMNLEKHSGGGDLSGPAIAACSNYPTLLHKAYLEEYDSSDIIIHDFPFTIKYDLFAEFDNKPRIYNAHNCETFLYQQLHNNKKSKPIHDLVKIYEKKILEIVDIVLYCNKEDLNYFKKIAPKTKFEALYTPNGMTPTFSTRHLQEKKSHAVFMGSSHLPNIDAANFIVKKLAPDHPNICFDIIGSCLNNEQYPNNIKRHGVVDDVKKKALLTQASLALNPMAAGSGSNVKVLEYFSYGLPVLSTDFGMRGISAKENQDFLLSSLSDFSETLGITYQNFNLLNKVGASGKKLAEKKYTWNKIVEPVTKKIEELIKNKEKQNIEPFILVMNDYDSFAGIGGGGTRTRGLYENASKWAPIIFLCFSNDGKLNVRNHSSRITIISIPKTKQHTEEIININSKFHISADDIIAIRHCNKNFWLNKIYSIIREKSRNIIIEHCYLTNIPYQYGDRFIYSSHNNETLLKNNLLKYHPLHEELMPLVVKAEKIAVEYSAVIIAVSFEDAESLVRGVRTAGPVMVVRNGADAPVNTQHMQINKNQITTKIKDHSAVFLGSAHMPNVEAAQFIISQLAPKLKNIQFHIIGSVCSAISNPPENVVLWGVLDDAVKSTVLEACSIALNPMGSGSGSNVKLADYIGHGLYVLSTEFGQRGYPISIQEHICIASMVDFSSNLAALLQQNQLFSDKKRNERSQVFHSELAMKGLAEKFTQTLQSFEKLKKRILYVTYRYVSPTMGGAEINIEKFVRALGESQHFDIDVIAPEVSSIHNHARFNEIYSFDSSLSAPVDIPNVRFARFPVDPQNPENVEQHLRKAWNIQPVYEREVHQQLVNKYTETGLTWGWSPSESDDIKAQRWAFSECAIHIVSDSKLEIELYGAGVVTTLYANDKIINGPLLIEGKEILSFNTPAGELRIVSSVAPILGDPRPLALRIHKIYVNDEALELSKPTLIETVLQQQSAKDIFYILNKAAEKTRFAHDLHLTDGRGPWSKDMEKFIAEHISEYDLVVTHNNVFRPAVIAIEEAKKQDVPSILIPHAHLDDDFYHFPDWLKSAQQATHVLAVPQVACDFLKEKDCNVKYLPAGCDVDEKFTLADKQAFAEIYTCKKPFILVLGRKAGAKGYQKIINAIDLLNSEGSNIQAVLIGPDDDRLPITSKNITYLGRQPRKIVRGALQSCLALVNMSVSESFGIVLLEAWLAGKPVIVNKHCAAFHDMAIDKENALLVNSEELPTAILKLHDDTNLRIKLATNGKKQTVRFDWKAVSSEFVDICKKSAKP